MFIAGLSARAGMLNVSFLITCLASLSSAGAVNNENKTTSNDTLLDLEEVIVTGRSGAGTLRKLDASYSITTVESEEIRNLAPLSLVDFLRVVPGLWVESSGGVANGNVRVRGIPLDGFAAMAFHEDGAPIQHDPGLGWRNVDQIIRLDETLETVRAVRGGTGSVFASAAPGGIVNVITKKAGEEPEGVFGYTAGDYGLHRYDAFFSTPLENDWGIALGGFYRQSDTTRDPGFTAEQGGQFRVTLSKVFDAGRVDMGLRYLDDNTTFLLPIPLAVDTNGNIDDLPGFNANTDSFYPHDGIQLTHLTPNGPRRTDLTNGTDVNHLALTVNLEYELGNDWFLKNIARYSNSDVSRNAIFGATPESAGRFIDSLRAAALAAFPEAADVRLQYTENGAAFDVASANGNGLVMGGSWNNVDTPTDEFNNTLTLSRSFNVGEQQHDVSSSFYYGVVQLDRDLFRSQVLFEVRGNPGLLDLAAINADGETVGFVTDNGVTRYGNRVDIGHSDTHVWAMTLSDEWQINPKLRIDAGIRYENATFEGAGELEEAVDLGDPNTLADDNVLQGNGVFVTHNREFDDIAWSLGANYTLQDNVSVHARYTDAFRLPKPDDFLFSPDRTDVRSQAIALGEMGIKWGGGRLSLFGNVFFTEYGDVAFVNETLDTAGTLIREQEYADIFTLGAELEVDWQPTDILRVQSNLTWQDAEFENFVFNRIVDGDEVQTDLSGRRPIRIPEIGLSVRPGVHLLNKRLHIYTEAQYFSDRFADAANQVELPSYTSIAAGVAYQVSDGLELRLVGNNLTNSIGLTEGNPRAGQVISSQIGSSAILARPILARNIRASFRYAF